MSYSQPLRRPQGARQRTQDRERQSSSHQSGSEASYRVTEDGFISSDQPEDGTSLSRTRRRVPAPLRSDTGASNVSISNRSGTNQYQSSQEHFVESPRSEHPPTNTSNPNIARHEPRSRPSLGVDAPHLYSSPALSMASLRRESEADDSRGYHPNNSSDSSRLPSLQSRSATSMPSSSSRQTSIATPPNIESRNDGTITRQQSTFQDSTPESDDASSSRSHTLSKWATIRRAIQTPPPPPVPPLPPGTAPSGQPGLRVTPAASSVSSSSAYGSATGFSIPRPGSAMSSLSDAALAPPPSTVSSSSSNLTANSRSARAVMNFRNAVDQARTGVAGMGSGLGGIGMGGLSALGGFPGRVPGAANAALQRQMAEDDSPFARELLQTCWVARFGTPPGGRPGHSTGLSTIGSAAAAGFLRPMRGAASEGGSAVSSAGNSGTSTPAVALSDVFQATERIGSLESLQHLVTNQASFQASQNQRNVAVPYFPHQGIVLSTILLPFLGTPGSDERHKRDAEKQQWIAVEIYELFTKAWPTCKRTQEEVNRLLWCSHAAAQESTNTTVRLRLLQSLDLALSTIRKNASSVRTAVSDNATSTKIPTSFSSSRNLERLAHSLFLIYPHVYGRESEATLRTLRNVTTRLYKASDTGLIGELELKEIEVDFGARGVSGETGDDYRPVILTSAAIDLLATGSESSRKWYLLNFIEDHWPLASPWRPTPLREQVERRKLLSFLKASLSLLRSFAQSSESGSAGRVGTKTFEILETRLMPEMRWLRDDLSQELRGILITTVLELLYIDDTTERARYLIEQWLGGDSHWKEGVETEVRRLILEDDQKDVTRCILAMRHAWPATTGEFPSSLLIKSIFERLTNQDPTQSSTNYEDILKSLASDFPQKFYAPLFACARSPNRTTVSKELRTLSAVSRAYPGFWVANAEMMCIALMSEPGSASAQVKGKQSTKEPRKWGKARLGQSVLFLELIAHARKLRKDRKEDNSTPAPALLAAINFFVGLETRIAVFLEAKELTLLAPLSTRLLIASLLMEIRLLSRSLKPASWLTKIVEWGCTSHPGAIIAGLKDPFSDLAATQAWTPVTDEVVAEVDDAIDSIRALYSSSWLETMNTPRNRSQGLPGELNRKSGTLVKSSELEQNLEVLASLPSSSIAIFQLLVAVSGILLPEHYTMLGPILWNNYLDSADENSLGPVAFLLMQSAEKDSSESVSRTIGNDLTGNSAFLKLRAIDRLTKLFSWRFQILTQPVITDRAHRRPFKSGRPPLSFVPTDIGSQVFVPDRVEEAEKLQFASTLPPEIRRRLIDLGWDKDATKEEKRPIQDMAPLSVVPSDRLAAIESMSLSSADPTNKGLLRRKSSSGSAQSGKRRPIFVASIAAHMPSVLQLTMSTDPELANVARPFILEVLRDDPGLFARPIMEQLSDFRDISTSVASLEKALRLQKILPSAFSHLVFNHLAGLLKTLTRDIKIPTAPMIYAYSLPSIALSTSRVSGISIRELKKAKLDSMLLPSGSLWFSDQMLPGPMFPRSLPASIDPSQPLPPALVAITMVRTAQNMMLTTLLKRDPKEVHMVRKTLTNFTLPSLEKQDQVDKRPDLVDYLPRDAAIPRNEPNSEQKNLYLISIALSRSHLLLVAQIFRCLSRQTTDYQEISQLLDGVNRILLRHGNDLGVVSHAMIDYMLAMTRFRRLFSSNSGFMLIMPAVWKTYCEAQSGNKAIRGVVEYATNRFHAMHPEAFVFQAVDVASAMLSHATIKAKEELAANVTSLFISLSGASRGEMNAGGIQNLTKMYEREAVLISLNDAPELIVDSLHRGESMSSVVDQFEGRPFPLENLARLCLTVIADDPFILRAERFLALFRYLVPSLYHNSMTARSFVGNGIEALGTAVFSKAGAPRPDQRSKTEDDAPRPKPAQTSSGPASTQSMFSKANAASNFNAMKQEYLHLIVAFTKAGGQLPIDVIRRALSLLQAVLRDSAGSTVQGVSLFLQELTESSLLREAKPPPKLAVALLSDILPLIYSHGYAIDFSGVFNVVTQLCKDEHLVEDPSFIKLVAGFSGAGLDALEVAAANNTLRGVQFKESFVSLIVMTIQIPSMNPLAQLAGRTPSAGLLLSFILPICLQIPRTSTIRNGANSLRRAWVQLLGFALLAFQKDDTQRPPPNASSGLERSNSLPQGLQNSPRGIVSGLLFALQVIKAIIVRGGEDIALVLPDVWQRVASVVKEGFGDGNGVFSLTRPADRDDPSSPFSTSSRPTTPNEYVIESSENALRVTDYGMWSILEMLCFFRTPLNLQLRLWLQEKLLQLESRIEATGGLSNRGSFVRDNRRLSFSPFTKTRRRSGLISATASPDASPAFRPSRDVGGLPTFSLGSPNTISTFDRFPQASPPVDGTVPRIRHLGPDFQTAKLQRPVRGASSASGGTNPLRAASKLITISRPKLVKESHRRVEAVRIFWGYETFVSPGDDMSAFEAWTSTMALRKIAEECQELAKEFHDVVKLDSDEGDMA
ncbi:hypothetical protein M408DRAFT_147787 [Serendipita vermifera MAFF 305830]|uniref:Protein UNC80 C-terminal domain-containing protein n=1 Tax=Serendipita vermifera MAFF 305830 TaxID=933852 RepID=A0A0C3B7F7_SERVB|nr:hypothetical protein M408DRAFT_147787 [Serendipita vermifera MAFF 305830]